MMISLIFSEFLDIQVCLIIIMCGVFSALFHVEHSSQKLDKPPSPIRYEKILSPAEESRNPSQPCSPLRKMDHDALRDCFGVLDGQVALAAVDGEYAEA